MFFIWAFVWALLSGVCLYDGVKGENKKEKASGLGFSLFFALVSLGFFLMATAEIINEGLKVAK